MELYHVALFPSLNAPAPYTFLVVNLNYILYVSAQYIVRIWFRTVCDLDAE